MSFMEPVISRRFRKKSARILQWVILPMVHFFVTLLSHVYRKGSALLYGSSVNQETDLYRTSVIDIPAILFTNIRCKTDTSLYVTLI